jgi:DNA-binding NtrC family response regulator
MKLLLVDDDPAALAYLSDVLRDRHQVTASTDGVEALERLHAQSFDAVLTDLRMPSPDGFDVLEAAQALDPPVPVIVLTALDTARAAVRALRLGARDFLVKPVEPEDIARALSTLTCITRDSMPRPDRQEETFGLIGISPPIQLVRRLIPALASSREAVLICGETGTSRNFSPGRCTS